MNKLAYLDACGAKPIFGLKSIKIIGSSLWSQHKNGSQNIIRKHHFDNHDRG